MFESWSQRSSRCCHISKPEKNRAELGGCGLFYLLAVLLISNLQGCARNWSVTLPDPGGGEFVVNAGVLQDLSPFAREDGSVPLEQILWTGGFYAIDRLILTESDGTRQELEWATAAEDAWWPRNGRVAIGGMAYSVTSIDVHPPLLMEQVQAYVTDIAPTVSTALGIPVPAQATGHSLGDFRTSHVLLLFLGWLWICALQRSYGCRAHSKPGCII